VSVLKRRWWFPSRGQAAIWGANTAVVVLASLITTMFEVVVDDIMPSTHQKGLPLAVACLVLFLVLLVFALLWRVFLWETQGTLFYVQGLDESMQNLHKIPLAAARDNRLAMRSLTRWVSASNRIRQGVIDMVEPCNDLGRAVEDAINTDRADTGYSVAPNMFWPMALAVGAYLPYPDKLKLLELGTNDEFSLTASGAHLLECKRHPIAGTGNRVGVWLALTPAAGHWSEERFAQFAVSEVHVVSYGGRLPGRDDYRPEYTRADLQSFGYEIARILHAIKDSAGNRELVVVAMIPKTTALAVGWLLSQIGRFSFFSGTHLIYYEENLKIYVPMRVRESQPTTPPVPNAGENESADPDIR
jgi:hypothetical protein